MPSAQTGAVELPFEILERERGAVDYMQLGKLELSHTHGPQFLFTFVQAQM